jgi:hypothetical protein
MKKINKRMNKRGQMGMALISGMFTALFVFVMLSAFLPVIISMLGTTQGSNSANCASLATCVSTGGAEPCYNSSISTDTITCSILSFTPGMLVLSIVFAVIAGIISGRLAMTSEQPMQPQYGTY